MSKTEISDGNNVLWHLEIPRVYNNTGVQIKREANHDLVNQ